MLDSSSTTLILLVE